MAYSVVLHVAQLNSLCNSGEWQGSQLCIASCNSVRVTVYYKEGQCKSDCVKGTV